LITIQQAIPKPQNMNTHIVSGRILQARDNKADEGHALEKPGEKPIPA
jgi:hypothetical protein